MITKHGKPVARLIPVERASAELVGSLADQLTIKGEVCEASCELDVGRDPADQLIAATSLVHNLPLVTRDRTLLGSRKVPLARI